MPTRAERLYFWWWYRSPNRPRIGDTRYQQLLAALPPGRGLDLGSRQRVRDDAITLDYVTASGVDLVGDGHTLPFADNTFDYVWSNAVLEHVRRPWVVAGEIVRVLKPGGMVFINVPFLEGVHGWPFDFWRFTPNGLRVLFEDLEEVASGTSAGPTQVLPDLVGHMATGMAELEHGRVATNLVAIVASGLLWPLRRFGDGLLRNRPSYWRWSRAFYYVGMKPKAGQ